MDELARIGDFLTGVGTLALAIGAVIGGLNALREYQERGKVDRVRWLYELYRNFYERPDYKRVRQLLDFEDTRDLFEILRTSEAEPEALRAGDRNLVDEFTDFLNFFEWIGFLCSSGQLKDADVDVMFAYYVKRLLQIDKAEFLRKYIQHNGYEQLDSLLSRYSAKA